MKWKTLEDLICTDNKNHIFQLVGIADFSADFFHPTIEGVETWSIRNIVDQEHTLGVAIKFISNLKEIFKNLS